MKRRDFLFKTFGAGVLLASYNPFSIAFLQPGGVKKKLGVALVGLGGYSSGQLAPALQETEHCYLAGIVTGTPEKEKTWSEKYNIPEKNIYKYSNFDRIAENTDIDIVYVVLPNSMHAEFSIRAAEAGKHVICEKPMATTTEDCRKIIDACKKARKKLSIGYRLHFEPHNLKMMELGQQKKFGNIKTVSGGHAFVLRDPNAWRIDKKLAGGGPLMDLGVYSVQSCIYTLGEMPVRVSAKNTTKNTGFFKEVEGSLEWEMEFASGAKGICKTSYEESYNFQKAEAQKGVFELQPAYSYRGISGKTPDGPMNLPSVNQQAIQMDAFALAVKQDKESIVPGEMGMRDVYIMEKIYEASQTGKTIELKDIPKFLRKV
jgi:predicted dehydrogenase